jgi:hypothetical protein
MKCVLSLFALAFVVATANAQAKKSGGPATLNTRATSPAIVKTPGGAASVSKGQGSATPKPTPGKSPGVGKGANLQIARAPAFRPFRPIGPPSRPIPPAPVNPRPQLFPRPVAPNPLGPSNQRQQERLRRLQDRADFLEDKLLKAPPKNQQSNAPSRSRPSFAPAPPNTVRILRDLGPHPALPDFSRFEVRDGQGRIRVILVPRQ